MRALHDHRVTRFLLRFTIVMLLGLLAWPLLQRPFSAAFRALGNAALDHGSFGKGGHALLVARTSAISGAAEDGPSWDTSLRLSVDGIEQVQRVSINPRRVAYIPLLMLLAMIVAAPLSVRGKALCAAGAVPALLLFAIGCQGIIAVWIFSRVPGLTYDLGHAQRTLIDLAYSAVAVPMEHKFLMPALLGGTMIGWQLTRERAAGSSKRRNRSYMPPSAS